MQGLWIRISVAAVIGLVVSVIGLIAVGERNPAVWLLPAIVSAAVYCFARLKIRKERK